MEEKKTYDPFNISDIVYEAMDEKSRALLQDDMNKMMEQVAMEQNKRFISIMKGAIQDLCNELTFDPWNDYYHQIDEYHFVKGLMNKIWNNIRSSNPKNIRPFDARNLLMAMKQNYPLEYHEMIHREYVERAEAAENKLKELSLKVIGKEW
jgi:hypothetical protein